MLEPIPDDPLEYERYTTMPTPEEIASAQAAAVTAAVEGERVRLEAEKQTALAAERNRSKEAREGLEAAQARAKELESAEAARQAKALEDSKEFEKLANHHKALAELAQADAAKVKADAAATVASVRAERDNEKRVTALAAVATAAGLISAEDLAKIDMSKISWDAEGKPVGAEAQFAELKTRMPHYFRIDGGAQPAPGGASGSGGLGNGGHFGSMLSATPARNDNGPKPADPYALTPEEFDRQYESLGKIARV